MPYTWLLLFVCLTSVSSSQEFLALVLLKAPHLTGGRDADWMAHKWHLCHPSASAARERVLQILWQRPCSSKATLACP